MRSSALRALAALGTLANACSFNSSGATGAGQDSAASDSAPDGRSDGMVDPGQGCSEISATISVDGLAWSDDVTPARTIVVGDKRNASVTVTTVSGQHTLAWSPTPATVSPITPSSMVGTIALYPTAPGDYHLSLRVTDPVDTLFCDFRVFAFRTLGPELQPSTGGSAGSNQINGITVGGGFVWVATNDGAWRTSIAPPRTWENVSDVFSSGPGFSSNTLQVAFFDDADQSVWYAAAGPQNQVFRIGLDDNSINAVDVSMAALAPVTVRDFSRGGSAVHLAGDQGVLSWMSGDAFTSPQSINGMLDLWALAEGAGTILWAAGQSLQSFGTLPGSRAVFQSNGDDQIRALGFGAIDTLWIGSDAFGLARFNVRTQALATWSTATAPPARLPSNRVRDVAPLGPDTWIATDQGAVRFKQDTLVTLPLMLGSDGSPLAAAQLDARAISAVMDDASMTRRVFIGTPAGLLVVEGP